MAFLEKWWSRFLIGLLIGMLYAAFSDYRKTEVSVTVFILVFVVYFVLSLVYGFSQHNRGKAKPNNPEILDDL